MAATVLLGGCAVSVGDPPAVGGDQSIPVPADAWPATVTYVHDGDTIYLSGSGRDEQKSRLIGIDTPEIGDAAECYGEEATELTRRLLPEDQEVFVTNDEDAFDDYGRELVYVWLPEGTFVNLAIIGAGAAEAVYFKPNARYLDELRDAEAEARDAGLGMWSGLCD